jgi:hypothetical protein
MPQSCMQNRVSLVAATVGTHVLFWCDGGSSFWHFCWRCALTPFDLSTTPQQRQIEQVRVMVTDLMMLRNGGQRRNDHDEEEAGAMVGSKLLPTDLMLQPDRRPFGHHRWHHRLWSPRSLWTPRETVSETATLSDCSILTSTRPTHLLLRSLVLGLECRQYAHPPGELLYEICFPILT